MTSISTDGGKGKGESVVIRLRMEARSPPGQGVNEEQAMVRGGGTERTNARDGGEGETDEE